jgi:hypothetical protein
MAIVALKEKTAGVNHKMQLLCTDMQRANGRKSLHPHFNIMTWLAY